MGDSVKHIRVGTVLDLFRAHRELSRNEVIELTGLSRSTINQRLVALVESGLIVALPGGLSSGGRPSSRFKFNGSRATIIGVDIGATGFLVAACDLNGTPLDRAQQAIHVWEGPEAVLSLVEETIKGLAVSGEIWAISIGVPGPVEYAARRVVNPPIMTGWDGFDIVSWFTSRFDSQVYVENDANARAVAESRSRNVDNLISLKLGTGIGAGLVFNGEIIRGDKGAAGDIGHTQAAFFPLEGKTCRCGNLDCVEAYAGGWAIQRDLAEMGIEVSSTNDIVALVNRGDIEAIQKTRAAGRVVGDAIADLVSILNPASIVLSGQLVECGEVLMSGIRERVYQHTVPLATKDLDISESELGEDAGVMGLALIAVDALLGTTSFEN